ncbi:MAG: tetratricopeptide repeat protein [Bryobacterales bacterium]|nr:tetratricopeptide repeat protein [Bryobacterales bacterium]
MIPTRRLISLPSILIVALVALSQEAAFAQQAPAPATPTGQSAGQASSQPDKAAAYYSYSLGHLYSELAAAYGNRGEYFSKAADAYRAALKADPSATFIAEELSDLYIQSGRLREGVLDAEDALKQNPNDLNSRRLLARIYTHLIGDSQNNQIDPDMVKKAIDQYQKITEADPKDTDSFVMLGRLQKAVQNSTEAMAAYKKALELDPDNEDAMTGLATVYADLGDNKAAADMLRKVADKDPTPRSLTNLANVYEELKDYSLAAEMLRRALDQQPGNAEVQHALAEDLLLSDQLDDALKLYQDSVQQDPKDIKAELRISQIYRQKRDFAKAREAADKAKEIDPNDLEVQFNDVNLLEAEGKIPDAIKTLKGILDATAKKSYSASEKSSRSFLLQSLGDLERTIEQYGPAVDTFRQLVDLDPDGAARAEAEIVETYREAKDYPKAEAEADAAVKKFPKDRAVSATRASVLSDMGKTDQAIAEARRLMNGKNDREVDLNLADIYDKAKNYTEMAKVLDAAEKLSQTSEEKQNVAFRRGAMYERMKNYQGAEAEFRKVLALNPDNDAALNYLGYMLADRDMRLDEARDLVSKAVAREPNSGAYLDSLGWVYFKMNKLPEAEDKLREALRYMSRDPTVHDHLAEVYFKEGKIRDAIAQWQSSVREYQSGPVSDMDHTELAKVQKKLEDAKVRLARETGVKQQ